MQMLWKLLKLPRETSIWGKGARLRHALLPKMDPIVTVPNLIIPRKFAEVFQWVFSENP